jgi:sterol desaturase/sphingolipid hydroxylase (fatty acid hydroxylase superfamily)
MEYAAMTGDQTTRHTNTGGYVPPQLPQIAPLYRRPFNLAAVLKYLFGWGGYFLPWQGIYVVLAIAVWWLFLPDTEQAKTLQFGWIAKLFLVNLVIIVAANVLLHSRLYVQRAQGDKTKFNVRWPKDNATWYFGSQLKDNVFLTIASAVPIWTAYLVVTLWLQANGWLPTLDLKQHPYWSALFLFLLYFWGEIHFFAIHRLIHWPPLYRQVHAIHHKNSNPISWSGLAMHPVEHILYYSAIIIQWIIPSNPLLVTYHLLSLNLGAAVDHTGFAKLKFNEGEREMEMGLSSYVHYLHHRYHEVNYGNQGAVPMDKIFGTWHDGSAEAHAKMMERRKKRSFPATEG